MRAVVLPRPGSADVLEFQAVEPNNTLAEAAGETWPYRPSEVQIGDANRYDGGGHKVGNVVITREGAR